MSEPKAPSVDPRFDPRFQRGYVPDAPPPADAGPAARPPAPETPGSPAPAPAPAADLEPTAGAPHQGVARTESIPHTAPTAEPERPSEADPASVFAALTDPHEESSEITPWFMAGWGVSVIAAVVGVALWWAGVATENFYGPTNESERWLQVIGWSVAPALIEVGLLGVVVMLVWAGIRHARRREERS